ncbi:DUF3857 domain-containing protein [Dokdonia ponticola]|uniref:DUF3857 domain-containing protein n=1 Tax=Dokdonia ponticola TaxID=2041041 RepID=A0ABV9HRU7_9FLAO
MSKVIKYCLKASLYGIIFLQSTCFFGQKKITFGNVSIEDFNEDYKSVFPSANAIVLYRYVEDDVGKEIVIHERIKILNELGYDFANVEIPYEDVIDIEGFTYNLIEGKVVVTKLDKLLEGTSRKVKIATLRKFTMPKVQTGSIIEYRYKASKGTFNDIFLQYEIPVNYAQVVLRNRSDYQLSFIQNSKALLDLEFKEKDSKTIVIEAKNVPAFEKEDYVDNLDSYRSKIEIKKAGFIWGDEIKTFRDFVDILLDFESFIKGYLPKDNFKGGLIGMIGDEKDEYKIAELIFNYLRKNIKWNGSFSIIPDNKSSLVTFQTKQGNLADINLLFVSMLKTIGIESSPILASTKSNGIPLTASLESFNYILSGAVIDYKQYIFDVTNPKSNFRYLPEMVVNWKGIMINENRSFSWVDLTEIPLSNINSIINVSINEDLDVEGEVQEQLSGYYAIDLKKTFVDDYQEFDIEDVVNKGSNAFIISQFDLIKHDRLLDKIVWSYKFEKEDELEKINDKVYLSPLFHLSLTESPFFETERKYPINFGFPKSVKKLIKIKIPDNYIVESIPASIKINLPDQIGSFTYNCKEVGSTIQIVTEFTVGQGEISSDDYPEIKEFFKLRVEKETEKIVLVKS